MFVANEKITGILIKHAANVNILTKKGQSALHLAAKSRNKFMIKRKLNIKY